MSKNIKKFIADGFNLIKESNDLTYKDKVDTIASSNWIFSWNTSGMESKAISHNALCLFIDNEFKLPRGLERLMNIIEEIFHMN